MTNTYSKAYTEVLTILSYFSKEEYNKIPKEKINFYKANMDTEYIYTINPKIDLSKQKISKEANAILISLFRDYFATEKQKETLKKLLIQNQQKLDKVKKRRYDPNNIFKEKNINTNLLINNKLSSKSSLIKVKKANIFQRLINKIKFFLHIN